MASRLDRGSESELAEVVIAWLEGQGYEIYQEVEPPNFHITADIVATKGSVIVVVECKTAMGLRVLDQAHSWVGFANLIYVAVPAYLRSRDYPFAKAVAAQFGIGILEVERHDAYKWQEVKEKVRPRLDRRINSRLRACLTEQHKSFAKAGTASGRRWTPFQNTCHELRRYAEAQPGHTLKEAVDHIKHHYSTPMSARQSLAKWIEGGDVPGLRIERIGRQVRVWPIEDRPTSVGSTS